MSQKKIDNTSSSSSNLYLCTVPAPTTFSSCKVSYNNRSYHCCMTTRISCKYSNLWMWLLYLPSTNNHNKRRELKSIMQTFDEFMCFFFTSWFFPYYSSIHHNLQNICNTYSFTKVLRLLAKIKSV